MTPERRLCHENPVDLIQELADRLEDCGRTDDYPFSSQPIINEDQTHEH